MPKRIVLLTTGTRGDIQPFIALALSLKNAGYDICLAAPENYLEEIKTTGLEAAPCGKDFRALMDDPDIRKILEGGIITKIRMAPSVTRKWMDKTITDMVKASKGADALLFHPKLVFATDIAEATGTKAIMCALQPFSPTAEFPVFMLPWRNLGRALNRASYKIAYLARAFTAKDYNKWRADLLGLPPIPRFTFPFAVKGKEIPILYGISPSILPRPRDWAEHIHLTGNWFLESEPDWTPPHDLQDFLDAGAPPIYVGFGSMPVEDPHTMSQMVLDALNEAGLRAVIAKGWGDFDPAKAGELPHNIHVIDAAPHEHLFPLMSAVVHHGGAGTTAAGLRAGKPTFICPFLVDQPYWGRRVQDLGAGPAPLAPKNWSIPKLTTAFHDLTQNQSYRKNAQAIGEKIAKEDGLTQAVNIIRKEIGNP